MSIELKPGWRRVRFSDVVHLNTERCADPAGEGIERYVGLEHLEPGDLRVRSWGLVSEGTTFTNRVRPGQVLFGKRRAYQRKVAVADFDAVCSSDIYAFESKNSAVLLPELLPHLCQTERFYEYAVGTSAGSLSPRTNWKQLAEYEFDLPPLGEQRRIAEVLGASITLADECADARSSCLRLIRSLRNQTFDPDRNAPVPLSTLCDRGGIQIGPFGAQLHQYDYVLLSIPVVMPVDMVEDRINVESVARILPEKAPELRNHLLRPGDILLPRRGELDRRAYVTVDQSGWVCGTGSLRIRAKDSVSSRAIFHALASEHGVRWLRANAVGTTMPNLNQTIVSKIPISLPLEPELSQSVVILDNLVLSLESIKERERQAACLHTRLSRDMLQ